MNKVAKVATRGLIALVAFNVAAAACFLLLRAEVRVKQPEAALAVASTFPAFSGTDVHGKKWQSQSAPCHVIRVTEDRCPYCQKDQPSYEKVLEAAQRASCEILEIAPHAGAMAQNPRPGVVQLQYVDVDIGSVLFPFITPQTIVLDRDWSVKMSRRGMFDEASLAGGLDLLRSFVRP